MPASLAAWKIFPSTSMLTALVHSSNRAYLGLTRKVEVTLFTAKQPGMRLHLNAFTAIKMMEMLAEMSL